VHAMRAETKALRNPAGHTFLHRDRLRDMDVVLVDDDAETRKLLTGVLRAAGANVLTLESASAALEAIDRKRPDIVITDIAMPEMDGYALTRALRERDYGPSLKIAALSAFPARTEEQLGFDAWLSKPIDPFFLIEEIARIAQSTATA